MQHIVLFEDEMYKNLLPMVYFRPVWELRCGALTLEGKIRSYLPGKYFFIARNYLLDNYLHKDCNVKNIPDNQSVLCLNGRWLFSGDDIVSIKKLNEGEALFNQGTALAFRISSKNLDRVIENGLIKNINVEKIFKKKEIISKVVQYLWDIIEWNGVELESDFLLNKSYGVEGTVSPGVHILAEDNVRIEKKASLLPGVVINAENGPVWIDSGATIMANAVLEGPVYIGKESRVKIGAKIYENTSIGPVCKIGGEVEGTIVQGYSNKQHDGFLGHSYLGSWVNIGADTNNSDLKNNYGIVRVLLNGKEMETGLQFVGLMMGDHSKTAINTMFNTGTIVGVNCNIFGAGMPPKFVPSFSWGGAEGFSDFDLGKAIDIARKVMSRRNVNFAQREEQLFREVKKLADKVEKSIMV